MPQEFASLWLRHAAECVLRANRIAGIEPVVSRQQCQPVTFAAARLRGKTDIHARRFLVLTVQCEPLGAGFCGAAESAAWRFAGRDQHREQQHCNGACVAVPLPGRMFLKIHSSCTFD